jgi:hypothetical protein
MHLCNHPQGRDDTEEPSATPSPLFPPLKDAKNGTKLKGYHPRIYAPLF